MEIRDVLEAFKKEIEKLYGKRLKRSFSMAHMREEIPQKTQT